MELSHLGNFDSNYDIWLEHSSKKIGYKLAHDDKGNPMITENIATFVAPQISQGSYSYDSTAAEVNVPVAYEDWQGGCGFVFAPSNSTLAKTVYAYASGIDASWPNRLYVSPAKQTGATTTQAPIKFVYSSLGVFCMTTRYVYEWASSTWTQRLDVGASLSCTDLIEYVNSSGTYLVLGINGGAYYHSTDGITWTTFPAGTAPAYRASNSANITSGTSLTVTKPAGTVDNDIMIATIIADNTATITPPAGWTQIAAESSTDGRARVYWKRASSEGASYAFTVEGTTVTEFSISSSGEDGYVYTDPNTITGDANIEVGYNSVVPRRYQAYLRFNTAGITDTDTVVSARLKINTVVTSGLSTNPITIGYYDHGGTITYAGDYSASPGDTTAGTYGPATTGIAYYDLGNLGNINKTGNTGFRFYYTGSSDTYGVFSSFDESDSSKRPILEVTTTASGGLATPATASISSYSGVITSGLPYDFVDSDYVSNTSQTTITSGTGTIAGSNRTVVVTFAATGDDTTARSWTASSGTERVDTNGASYYPTISTYDVAGSAGVFSTITGTVNSAYDSLALGCMIALIPASSGSPQVSVHRFAVRGMASGEPLLWAVNSSGDIRNTSDPTNASSWSAADTTQLGEPSTISGLEVLNNVFYLYTKKGITSYNGTTVSTVWNNTTLTLESDAARPYTWVDLRTYFTYNGGLYRFDSGESFVEKIWPHVSQQEEDTRSGTITSITGDSKNLYFTIKNLAGNYVLMKCDPYRIYDVGGTNLMPAFDINEFSTNACGAMIVVPGASDTLHTTNPQLVYGYGTNANYLILTRNGALPSDDSNYRFDTATGTIIGAYSNAGARLFPKFANSATFIAASADANTTGVLSVDTLSLTGASVTTSVATGTTSSGPISGNITSDIQFSDIRYNLTMDSNTNTTPYQVRGIVINTSLNPTRMRMWNITVDIAEELERIGGGDSSYGAHYLADHLFNGLTQRVSYYDRGGTAYVTRILDVKGQHIGRDKIVYNIVLVQLY